MKALAGQRQVALDQPVLVRACNLAGVAQVQSKLIEAFFCELALMPQTGIPFSQVATRPHTAIFAPLGLE